MSNNDTEEDKLDLNNLMTLEKLKTLTTSDIEKLNTDEQIVIKQVIRELAETGSSQTLKDVWYSDYDEIPVDIDTFITDDRYLGKSLGHSIYPFWRKELRKLFAPGVSYNECLTGDTEIPLLDGTSDTLESIHNRVQSGEKIETYSLDKKTGKVVPGHIVMSKLQGKRTVYKITLSNGRSIKATGNHKFMLDNMSDILVDDLSAGDSLMPYKGSSVIVTSIEELPEKENVYDITVDKYHTFATCSGIIVNNCILTGGIGLGKTSIADIGLAYILYKLMCLKNPQEYYGLNSTATIAVAFFNITLSNSYGVAYGKMQDMLKNSPWFLEHGQVVGNQNLQYVPGKSIELIVG